MRACVFDQSMSRCIHKDGPAVGMRVVYPEWQLIMGSTDTWELLLIIHSYFYRLRKTQVSWEQSVKLFVTCLQRKQRAFFVFTTIIQAHIV